MNRTWKWISLAGLLAAIGGGVAQASITDRFESGRLRVKGWRTEAWPTAQGIRIVQTPMMVSTSPSGRVSYSSAFQAPATEGGAAASASAAPMVIYESSVSPTRNSGAVPAAIPRSFKGTYRNSK